MKSKDTLIILYIILGIVSFVYYPKWKQSRTEATISWDTSGYYWYLPAVFIYKDINKLEWSQKILDKYSPSPQFDQAFDHWNNSKIMKYSSGMAVQYLPFFLTAHILAEPLGFEADGFSLPYQFAIQFGSLLMCFIGLWFYRKVLLHFFSETVTSIILIAICLGTNYLNSAAIDGAMTHNWLFSWYSILLFYTIQFYKNPKLKYALIIGAVVGICGLTRPTDLLSALIPLLWGFKDFKSLAITSNLTFIKNNISKLLIAAVITVCIGFIQPLYWKMVGENWIIYSYQGQGFSWLSPHVKDYLFSFSTGWLIYQPLFFLLFPAIFLMVKSKSHGWIALLTFAILNTYVVTAWDYWMYGGRAMVQSYPVLGIILGYFVNFAMDKKILKWVLLAFIAMCIYLALWWTHGVHKGGYYDAYNSTKAYFYRNYGRWSRPDETIKLYDTDELYEGERKNVKIIYENNLDNDSTLIQLGKKLNDSTCDFVSKERQFTNAFKLPITSKTSDWIRVISTIKLGQKEWDMWKQAQYIVIFKNQDQEIKRKYFKPHRFLNDGETRDMYLDVKVPDGIFTNVEFLIWNCDSDKEVLVDNLKVETFDED